MKNAICSVLGMIGATIAAWFGGWSAGMMTLLIFQIIDYASGLIVAGVFKKSDKSATGALESGAGWKGLLKKGMTWIIVLVAYRLDVAIGSTYVKDAAIIGFIVNETISIIENAGLMGLPLPAVIMKAIDVLRDKGNTDDKVKES